LRSGFIKEICDNQATGIAQKTVTLSVLRTLPIPLPPLSEQHRIVAKIEELMPLVEEYDKAQKELDALNAKLPEALKKSILQEAIQGKLVPQDPNDEPASVLLQRIRKEKEQLVKDGKLKKKDLVTTPITDEEKPFEIPENWEWCRLGEIFSHNNGKQLNRADTQGDYHDYITTSNLYWDKFDFKEVRQMLFTKEELVKCTATKGDLLVCEGGDVGRSAIWDFDYDICIQNHIHRLRAYLPLCTRFFLYLLMFNKSIGVIGGKGIGIQGLSAKVLHNILFPLPPLSEQHRIVSKIEDLFARIEPLAKALSTPM
jgi:type I restriction enzyme S subunit